VRSSAGVVALCVVTLATPATPATPAGAQTEGTSSGARAESTVVVVPGARYRAGAFHEFFLGENYRELWATPIRVDVLSLSATGGGLTPTERGGGLQTASLRFKGGDGREYVFRSLDKDPSRALPEELRETIVEGVHQDQVSAFHPAAALVVARLLDATRIRHVNPRLVVLPDDARLGEFRADFAGTLGIFEERPEEGFEESDSASGATRVISTERLFERMMKNGETRVDTRAFLAARLFDVFVGDRDRHRDQWRWATFAQGDDAQWEPIPRDRDMAFVKHEGLFPTLARQVLPQIVTFDDHYPRMVNLNWNAREMDRRLLVGLERPVWDSASRALQAQLTDAVIDDAIGAMPPELVRENGAELRAALRRRRDRLPEAAAAFYDVLAAEVDFTATEDPDLADVTYLDDGSVQVALFPRSSGDAHTRARAPYLRRRFDPRETREVRIYLHDGDDRAVVRGGPRDDITVRVIGGNGDDELVDSSRAGARFYDAAGNDRVTRGPDTELDDRRYTPPETKGPQDPPRDWGRRWVTLPWVSHAPDIGLFLGASVTHSRYAFRTHPYKLRVRMEAGYAFEAKEPRLQILAEHRWPSSDNIGRLELRASGVELIRFYGLGNETTSEESESFYRVFQTQYLVEPTVVFPLSPAISTSLGAVGQLTNSEPRNGTLLDALRPYGTGQFVQLGARLGIAADTRDTPIAAKRGIHAVLAGSLYPSALDVASTFGELHGSVATYHTAQSIRTTFAFRAAGKHVFGRFPFFESAFVGGSQTLRGWGEQRFAGRSAVYGNAEVRLFLSRFRLFVPGEMGIFGLFDVGRVYASSEDSDRWHTGVGGGVWAAPVWREHTVSIAVARGKEETGFYVRTGFLF
jgi:hypothetical protein